MLLDRLPNALRAAAHRRKFIGNRDDNLFMGSYADLDDALRHAPASARIGYDHAASAELYSHQIAFYDYPSVYWLGESLRQGMRTVFDLGGHVGIKYYAFRRIVDYPVDLRWTVCDVPAVVQSGASLALSRDVTAQLAFTTDTNGASGCDVLFASGSLQYLRPRLTELVGGLAAKPRRIILNATAVHPDKTLYTLNSIGVAVCPYRIQHHDELLAELVTLGYRRRDGWRNVGKPIVIPGVDGGDKAQYIGCCYDLNV